jgi:hypothetical protein
MHCDNDWAARNHAHEESIFSVQAEVISNRVSDLTAKTGEFYPFKQEHIMAFFGDMLPHQEAVLQAAIETPGADISQMIRHWITMYWENQAEKQAIRELMQLEHDVDDYQYELHEKQSAHEFN